MQYDPDINIGIHTPEACWILELTMKIFIVFLVIPKFSTITIYLF